MLDIKYEYNGIDIEVSLYNGLNILDGYSGDGKTLLLNAIEAYCIDNDIIYAYINYRNMKEKDETIEAICTGKDIILIDDADLFINNTMLTYMIEHNKHIIMSIKNTYKIDERKAKKFFVQYDKMELRLEEI